MAIEGSPATHTIEAFRNLAFPLNPYLRRLHGDGRQVAAATPRNLCQALPNFAPYSSIWAVDVILIHLEFALLSREAGLLVGTAVHEDMGNAATWQHSTLWE